MGKITFKTTSEFINFFLGEESDINNPGALRFLLRNLKQLREQIVLLGEISNNSIKISKEVVNDLITSFKNTDTEIRDICNKPIGTVVTVPDNFLNFFKFKANLDAIQFIVDLIQKNIINETNVRDSIVNNINKIVTDNIDESFYKEYQNIINTVASVYVNPVSFVLFNMTKIIDNLSKVCVNIIEVLSFETINQSISS